jgi:hypothetical protein
MARKRVPLPAFAGRSAQLGVSGKTLGGPGGEVGEEQRGGRALQGGAGRHALPNVAPAQQQVPQHPAQQPLAQQQRVQQQQQQQQQQPSGVLPTLAGTEALAMQRVLVELDAVRSKLGENDSVLQREPREQHVNLEHDYRQSAARAGVELSRLVHELQLHLAATRESAEQLRKQVGEAEAHAGKAASEGKINPEQLLVLDKNLSQTWLELRKAREALEQAANMEVGLIAAATERSPGCSATAPLCASDKSSTAGTAAALPLSSAATTSVSAGASSSSASSTSMPYMESTRETQAELEMQAELVEIKQALATALTAGAGDKQAAALAARRLAELEAEHKRAEAATSVSRAEAARASEQAAERLASTRADLEALRTERDALVLRLEAALGDASGVQSRCELLENELLASATASSVPVSTAALVAQIEALKAENSTLARELEDANGREADARAAAEQAARVAASAEQIATRRIVDNNESKRRLEMALRELEGELSECRDDHDALAQQLRALQEAQLAHLSGSAEGDSEGEDLGANFEAVLRAEMQLMADTYERRLATQAQQRAVRERQLKEEIKKLVDDHERTIALADTRVRRLEAKLQALPCRDVP